MHATFAQCATEAMLTCKLISSKCSKLISASLFPAFSPYRLAVHSQTFINVGELRRTSSLSALSRAMHNSSDALDADVEYELCSASSSNETADDLPGLGRVLGNLYTSVGRKLENGLGNVAVRMGRGPNATALKIQRILGDKSLRSIARRKKLRKKCKSLARYIK